MNYSGFKAVRTISLETDGNEYILRAVLELKGIARLTGYGPVVEESRFTVVDGVIQPLLYVIGEQKENPKRDIRIEFDWARGISRGFAKGEEQNLPLEKGIQDPLTFELMGRLKLTDGERKFTMNVHEGHRIRQYTFVPQREEMVNVASRADDAEKFFIDRNSSRELYYWFNPEYLYLPLMIQQVHGQKISGTVSLTSSSLLH